MILWYIHALSLLFCTPYTLAGARPRFFVKTKTDMVSLWAAGWQNHKQQTLADGAGGEHTAAFLRAWGSAATKCIQTTRQALTSWQVVQVAFFPGSMMYWDKLHLGDLALVHVHILWSEDCCTIPNIYPVELIHLWV